MPTASTDGNSRGPNNTLRIPVRLGVCIAAYLDQIVALHLRRVQRLWVLRPQSLAPVRWSTTRCEPVGRKQLYPRPSDERKRVPHALPAALTELVAIHALLDFETARDGQQHYPEDNRADGSERQHPEHDEDKVISPAGANIGDH